MTNRERLNNPMQSCPYALAEPPVDAAKFCDLGCSVDCKEIIIEQLSRTKTGKAWLNAIYYQEYEDGRLVFC